MELNRPRWPYGRRLKQVASLEAPTRSKTLIAHFPPTREWAYDPGMRVRRIHVLLIAASIGPGCISSALADCTCRAGGRDYELGQTVCLRTPAGPRLATCGMVLNNTSWQFSSAACVIAGAVAEPDDGKAAIERRAMTSQHAASR